MELNEILECINLADYEGTTELSVSIHDLKTLRNKIKQLQTEVNELTKANSILAHIVKPKSLSAYKANIIGNKNDML